MPARGDPPPPGAPVRKRTATRRGSRNAPCQFTIAYWTSSSCGDQMEAADGFVELYRSVASAAAATLQVGAARGAKGPIPGEGVPGVPGHLLAVRRQPAAGQAFRDQAGRKRARRGY